jgi:predicted ribosome quality control (RQC) complex YloA/Tae2 family protein
MTNSLLSPQNYAQPKHRAAQAPAKPNGGTASADYSLHPKAQEAVAVFSDAMRELDNAREVTRAMQHKIDVQENTIRELQYALDGERNQKEAFQRYCVTVQTLIETISRAAQQAAAAALDNAVKVPPKQVEAPKPQSQVEADVENALKGFREAAQAP